MKTNLQRGFPASRTRAFSLVEILVVISIIIILTGLVVQPAMQIVNGMAVTSGGQMIQSRLAIGRQLSISRNRTVEIRFFEVPDPLSPSQSHFRLMQAWIFDANGTSPVALDKVAVLPRGIIIESTLTGGSAAYSSTLLDSAPHKGSQVIPSVGTGNYPYRAFRFRGNGSTDLEPNGTGSDTWFLTVRLLTDLPSGTGTLPKNYYTLQIDPLTGQTKAFRP